MHTITVAIADNSIAERILWFLEHFKKDGVEVLCNEDIEDLRLIAEAKKEGAPSIPLETLLKEYDIES